MSKAFVQANEAFAKQKHLDVVTVGKHQCKDDVTKDYLASTPSWAGVCPGNNESAGKKKSGKARKGNPYVRRVLCEAANAASRTRCCLQDKFKGIMLRRGRKRAIFAIAHKLLKTVYLLIERSDYYRDADTDYEALSVQRNAPRWIKKLKQYGYITA